LIKHPKIEWATNLYPIHKINVRNPDIKILYKHPYIGRDKAKNLIEYIRVRGGLTPENFAEMRSFDAFEKERLYPYLEFQPTN
jgi:predicted DNA-binding helix-hairpin-helix protein